MPTLVTFSMCTHIGKNNENISVVKLLILPLWTRFQVVISDLRALPLLLRIQALSLNIYDIWIFQKRTEVMPSII